VNAREEEREATYADGAAEELLDGAVEDEAAAVAEPEGVEVKVTP
jgi:hypothetical protein